MFKKFTPALVLGTVLATSLVSRKDTTVQDLRVSADAPTLVNGRLNFASLESFHAYMQANQAMGFVSHLRLDSEPGVVAPKPVYASTLHCLHDGEVNSLRTNVSTAKNATAAATNAVAFEDEPATDVAYPYIDTSIPDPLFESVLDENREMTINNLVYRAGNDYCFYYPRGQEALVEDFYQKVDAGEIALTDTEMHAYGNLIAQRVYLVTNNTESAMASAFALPSSTTAALTRTKTGIAATGLSAKSGRATGAFGRLPASRPMPLSTPANGYFSGAG